MLEPLTGKPATAPAGQPLARRTALAAATQRQPRGDDARSLTPQFHWNLNDSALRSLADDERAALYQLFRFYDSSFRGDALPAIHLFRLLELLRDAQLLANDGDGDEGDDGDDELQPQTVERVFAQAVLGKLRTYLDAEDEPALPFQLFSGALFHCAMIKFPDVMPPEQAFRRLIERVLTLQPRAGNALDGARGLVRHAEQAAIPSWSVQDLYDHCQPPPVASATVDPEETPPLSATEAPANAGFLQREVFQQVVAELSLDRLVDEQRRARLEELYVVPEELTTHFSAEIVRFITERFRTFDVFDRGVLPRDEVFALLSGMAKRLEITDVYEVLAVILAGELGDRKQLPRGSLVLSAPSKIAHVSLAQVIHALHVCRRARTASYQLSQQNQHRKVGGVAAGQAKQTTQAAGETAAAAETTGKTATGKKGAHGAGARTGKGSDKKPTAKGKASGGSSAAQHKQASPTKSTGSTAKAATSSSGVLSQSGAAAGAKRAGAKAREKKAAAAGSGADAGLLRRLSKMSASSSETSTLYALHDNDDANAAGGAHDGETAVRQDSFRSASSSSSAKVPHGVEVLSLLPKVTVTAGATPLTYGHEGTPDARDETELSSSHPLARRTVLATSEPAPALALRMFHTRGQTQRPAFAKYDGAICLTIQLHLAPPPARIVTVQGVHFLANGDRDEVWSTETTALDEKLPLEVAVAALKTLVDEKERLGFELVPDREQREAMHSLMREIRDAKCPRYAATLHSPKKTKPSSSDRRQDELCVLRRDGVAVRPSLDRGSTWVREPSSGDLLSDAQLEQRLQRKRQEALLLASRADGPRPRRAGGASRTPEAAASPTTRRPCEWSQPQCEPRYDQIIRRQGLTELEGSWIATLSAASEPPGLRTSQSLPRLVAQRPPAASSVSRRG